MFITDWLTHVRGIMKLYLFLSGLFGCGGKCQHTCQQQRTDNTVRCRWGTKDENIFEVCGFSLIFYPDKLQDLATESLPQIFHVYLLIKSNFILDTDGINLLHCPQWYA